MLCLATLPVLIPLNNPLVCTPLLLKTSLPTWTVNLPVLKISWEVPFSWYSPLIFQAPIKPDYNCPLLVYLLHYTSCQLALKAAHLTQCLVHGKNSTNTYWANEQSIDQPSFSMGQYKVPSCPRAAFLFEMKAFSRLNVFLEPHLIG
jgi:hypothetical protein